MQVYLRVYLKVHSSSPSDPLRTRQLGAVDAERASRMTTGKADRLVTLDNDQLQSYNGRMLPERLGVYTAQQCARPYDGSANRPSGHGRRQATPHVSPPHLLRHPVTSVTRHLQYITTISFNKGAPLPPKAKMANVYRSSDRHVNRTTHPKTSYIGSMASPLLRLSTYMVWPPSEVTQTTLHRMAA